MSIIQQWLFLFCIYLEIQKVLCVQKWLNSHFRPSIQRFWSCVWGLQIITNYIQWLMIFGTHLKIGDDSTVENWMHGHVWRCGHFQRFGYGLALIDLEKKKKKRKTDQEWLCTKHCSSASYFFPLFLNYPNKGECLYFSKMGRGWKVVPNTLFFPLIFFVFFFSNTIIIMDYIELKCMLHPVKTGTELSPNTSTLTQEQKITFRNDLKPLSTRLGTVISCFQKGPFLKTRNGCKPLQSNLGMVWKFL